MAWSGPDGCQFSRTLSYHRSMRRLFSTVIDVLGFCAKFGWRSERNLIMGRSVVSGLLFSYA
jgi:hypothetical protein